MKYELFSLIMIPLHKIIECLESPPKVGEIFLLTVNLARVGISCQGRLIPNRLPIVVIVKLGLPGKILFTAAFLRRYVSEKVQTQRGQ